MPYSNNTPPKQKAIQSANVDWVSIALTTTPQRIADLLVAIDWHSRWGYARPERALENIVAISFPAQDSRPVLLLRRAEADTAIRRIPDNFGVYVPVAEMARCWLSAESGATVVIEILHEMSGDPVPAD